MNPNKSAFIELALASNVLTFGDFTLKSGRKSPYFFNAGQFFQNNALKHVGEFYAKAIIDSGLTYQHLFGPAYKGIPLATTTAVALGHLQEETTVTFNRKEMKDHGEGGSLMGAPLCGPTLIIDDVITAGTAFRESKQLIEANGGEVAGLIIALDRCELGEFHETAIDSIRNQGITVISLITAFDLIDYLKQHDRADDARRLDDHLSIRIKL
jgi:orotate phosphoribosyltransferase